MNAVAEVRGEAGWRRLGSTPVPRIGESETIRIRGLRPRSAVRIGFTELSSDDAGEVSLRPHDDEHLRGHVGLVEVAVEGAPAGEIELVPQKMSEDAYRTLRAELHRLWTDLVFADDGAVRVEAGPPPARELWRRIDRPLRQIVEHPSTRLDVGIEPKRLERVRRRREVTPAVVRAGQRGRSALTRTLHRSTNTPENDLCAATLRLLRDHARRDPTADDVVTAVDRVLADSPFTTEPTPVRRVTWGMRSDQRYRQLLAVYQVLNRPELQPTEGPGELRLGVPALPRLYEYWVFLKVLEAASRRYGPPEAPGLAQLATPVRGRKRRLELRRGTTVTFRGPVHVAFEPDITARADGWMGVEYVPHPDPARQQLQATPDVVVLDLTPSRPAPAMLVIDAKYVGRHFVELESARVHEKYARMRLRGVPIVHNVLVAHPHLRLERQWAGYGCFPLVPGDESTTVTLSV